VVEAVGEGVTDLTAGDVVVLNWRAGYGAGRVAGAGRGIVLMIRPPPRR